MNDYKEYLNWLSAKGVTRKRQIHYANTIKRMLGVGISGEELLHGDIVAVIDEYVNMTGNHYTQKTYGQYRYMIRKYREFRGFMENPSAIIGVKPSDKTDSSIPSHDEFVNGLIDAFGISFVYANSLYRIICKLRASGINEQDILGGDVNILTERFYSLVKHEYKDNRVVGRAIAYYRLYVGVPTGGAGSERLSTKHNRLMTMKAKDYEEKESFRKWFNERYAAKERGLSYYYDICRIRDSGISETDILKNDERDTCDRYCQISGLELSRSLTKEYRKAVRLFQNYKQAVAE